jgi:hypothetical protein
MNAPVQSSRQLADNLLTWHEAISVELQRDDMTADDFERSGAAQLQSAQSCAAEAVSRLDASRDTYLALMSCSARYLLTARAFLARADELRSRRRPRLVEPTTRPFRGGERS